MSPSNEPPFAISGEDKLNGEGSEFSECKSLFNKYLTGISANAEVTAYTFSPKWGYILRATYVGADTASDGPSKGTFMCWRSADSSEIRYSIDPRGQTSDLI